MGKIAYKLAAAKLRVMGYRRADGFVGAYVAKNGDIRVIADDGKVGSPQEYVSSSGYRTVLLEKDQGTVQESVHRIVGKAWVPNPDRKPEINHKDGNKLKCNASNLEWVTHKENIRHAYAMGLAGGPKTNRRLTDDQVRAIRKDPRPSTVVCKEYGVGSRAIRYIRAGVYYKDVI